ncbi:unnamed protein product [Ceratitis capitata]|uniref:(Mediterranean fruit fly) hypothetical protein n=1 Tax=Ceratitis capitata TaxID=7213 RepID=A0A811V0I8_CERCA|nr:unnamed protein product [Ceratitis capitata]
MPRKSKKVLSSPNTRQNGQLSSNVYLSSDKTSRPRRILRSSNSNPEEDSPKVILTERNGQTISVSRRRTRSGNSKKITMEPSEEVDSSNRRRKTFDDKENPEETELSPEKIAKYSSEKQKGQEGDTNAETKEATIKSAVQIGEAEKMDCGKREQHTPQPMENVKEKNTEESVENEAQAPKSKSSIESPNKESKSTHRAASIDKLTTLFSNLYLNSVQRLRLGFPPRCAEDLVYCRKQHFQQRFNEMDKPSEARLMQLRCTLKQQRYLSFINLALDMCQRREFPGEDTFTNLIELILSLNPKTGDAALIRTYIQSIELFSYMVRAFPPCWRATHTAYIGFFQRPLDAEKLSNKSKGDNRLSKSKKVFDIILDLTEMILNECTTEELGEPAEPKTPKNDLAKEEGSVVTETPSSEQFDHHKWDERDNRLNTFIALRPMERVERLFIVLRLILQILESDYAMWMLHHYRKNKSWLFYNDSRPLAVFVLGMSEEAHLSALGRQLFLLFALAVNKGLNLNYLKILERYISLLMVISNTADIEHTVLGVKFPRLGPNTKQLILDFFRKFKDRNLNSSIENYIRAINVLRIPYVRYTFIDLFLQMFGFLYGEDFSPEKVFHYMRKKRWLKHKKQADLQAAAGENDDVVDEISCEQHLSLLLEALKAYCEWYASKEFMNIILNKSSISSLKITTHSVHHTPIAYGGLLNLARMENEIQLLGK